MSALDTTVASTRHITGNNSPLCIPMQSWLCSPGVGSEVWGCPVPRGVCPGRLSQSLSIEAKTFYYYYYYCYYFKSDQKVVILKTVPNDGA